MIKKVLSLLAVSSLLLVAGCNGPKQDLGGFLGEFSCLTAEVEGKTDTDDITQVAVNHGFGTETSVKELVQNLDEDQLQKELDQGASYISANCQDLFDEVGIDPTEFLTEALQDY